MHASGRLQGRDAGDRLGARRTVGPTSRIPGTLLSDQSPQIQPMAENIRRWLQSIGLEQFAETFADNAIGLEHLPDLDHEILKEIGVRAVGHRLTILRAAADYSPRATADNDEDDSGSTPPANAFAAEAERRQLTVMFCDLVGSTELSQRLDPEDLSEVTRAYQDACKAAVERYEGYVARYMGDGVLAYFGYPQAHEDDAERAIRAGLSVVDAIGRLNETAGHKRGVDLRVRVGMATGQVVVGDIVGEGAAQESTVVGETPNLAARLQALAEPNTVVIGRGTYELAAGRFDYQDLGVHDLKGIEAPVPAWRVVAPASVASRFEALHRSGFTPLVGREHEIGLLLERWEQAKDGDGQVVLLSGEAGIGKSRITETLSERTGAEQRTCLRYQCSPYHANSALHPVIEQLERAARFGPEDCNESKLDKLESLLLRADDHDNMAGALLAPLLSIPTGNRYAPLDMTPERQKERTLEALADQLDALSRQSPVLFIFEDAHWADPTSLELLELIVERTQDLATLAVITLRPEFAPPWVDHTHVTSLTLNRFTRRLASAMIEKVTAGKRLPVEVQDQIIEKTDGVPLFVEELTKSILESGQLTEEADGYVLAGSPAELAIPATLHDSLVARLDRLGAVKEVAQAASAIGREFDYDLLAAISALDFAELSDTVAQLIEAGLVFRQGRAGQTSYVFKHALVRDAAYRSLLRGTRRELHGRIADALRSRFPETAHTQPELLAHHYTEASESAEAVSYWLQAGRRAAERSANQEAVRHLQKGLAVLQSLPASTQRAREELALHGALSTPLMAVKGYSSEAVLEICTRARELCELTGDTEELFPALYGQWAYQMVGGNCTAGQTAAEEMLELAQRHQEQSALLIAHRLVGWGAFVLGDLPRGWHHIRKAAELYDPERHGSLALRYGHNPMVAVLANVATYHWVTGRLDEAWKASARTIAHGRESGHAASLSYGLVFAGAQLAAIARLPQAALGFAEECMELGQQQGIRSFMGWSKAAAGWATAGLGDFDKGRSLLEEGLEDLSRSGVGFCLSLYRTLYAEVLLDSGDLGGAQAALSGALRFIEKSGERWYQAEATRLLGELHVRMGAPEEGESQFRRALELARELGETSFALRAATCLARLPASAERSAKARADLAGIVASFTEGFDTSDLKEARALLDASP